MGSADITSEWRLSGDRDTWLGEIIRICILNIDYVGGASGLMGIPRF